MEAHRGFSRAGSTLDDQKLVELPLIICYCAAWIALTMSCISPVRGSCRLG
jgi:hypothetical protein